jgi:hypothetical protein
MHRRRSPPLNGTTGEFEALVARETVPEACGVKRPADPEISPSWCVFSAQHREIRFVFSYAPTASFTWRRLTDPATRYWRFPADSTFQMGLFRSLTI